MAFAVVLRLDAATAGFIDAMAHALPEGRDDDPRRSYPPHIKLAVFGDSVDVADLDAALAAATGRWPVMPIALAGIGVFPSDPPIVGLLPIPTADLFNRHATVHRALADLPTHPGYEVGGWLPQVTLDGTNFVGDAVEALTSMWDSPIVGWLDCLDLIRLEPIARLSARPLRA
jgi:hypothetical protein